MKTDVPDKSQLLLDERSRHEWARDILAIPAEASPDAVRSELLGRLEEFDFMPPPPIRQAIGFLNHDANRDAPEGSVGLVAKKNPAELAGDREGPFGEDIEARLSDDIEEFARTYFEQPCLERRARWGELTAHARPFPRLRMRLAPLLAGLDVATVVPEYDARAELLARRVRMLYVLPPAQQECVRQQWIREMRNSGPWKSDVLKFRAHYSKLAWLEPDLLSTLEILENTEPRREAPKTAIPGLVVKTKTRFTPTVARRSPTSRSRVPIFVMLIWVSLAGNLIRYVGQSATHLSSPNKTPTMTFTVPDALSKSKGVDPKPNEPFNSNPFPNDSPSESRRDTPTVFDPTTLPNPEPESATGPESETRPEQRAGPGDDKP